MAPRRKTVDVANLAPAPEPAAVEPKRVHVSAKEVQERRAKREADRRAVAMPPAPAVVPESDAPPVRDEEAAELAVELQQREEEKAQGKDGRKVARTPGKMSYADRFDYYVGKNWNTRGRLIAYIRRLSPNEIDLGEVDLRVGDAIDSFGLYVDHVRRRWWDGQASVYDWTVKLSGEIVTSGRMTLEHDEARALEYDRQQAARLRSLALPDEDEEEDEEEEEEEEEIAAVTQTAGIVFCQHCGVRGAAGAAFCAGCGRPKGTPVAPPVMTSPSSSDGAMVTVLREALAGRSADVERLLLEVRSLAEKVGHPMPAAAPTPAAPPAPEPVRLQVEGRWGTVIGPRWVADEPAKTDLPRVQVEGRWGYVIPTGNPAEPLKWIAETTEPAKPAITGAAGVAAVVEKARAERDQLSAALGEPVTPKPGEKEEEEEEELPDGHQRIGGKGGLIVSDKFMKSSPLISFLLANGDQFLPGIKMAWDHWQGSMAAERDEQVKAAEATAKAAAANAAAIKKANDEEERTQRLRDNRLRQQRDEMQLEERRKLAGAELGAAPASPGRTTHAPAPVLPASGPSEPSEGPPDSAREPGGASGGPEEPGQVASDEDAPTFPGVTVRNDPFARPVRSPAPASVGAA